METKNHLEQLKLSASVKNQGFLQSNKEKESHLYRERQSLEDFKVELLKTLDKKQEDFRVNEQNLLDFKKETKDLIEKREELDGNKEKQVKILKKLQEEMRKSEEKLNKNNEVLVQMRKELADLKGKIEQTATEINTLVMRIKENNDKIDNLENANKRLAEKIEEIQKETAELSEIIKEIVQKMRELDSLQKTKSELLEADFISFDQKTRNKEELMLNLKKNQTELKNLQDESSDLVEKAKMAEENLKFAEIELRKMMEVLCGLKEKEKETNQENATLNIKKRDDENQIRQVSDELRNLSAETRNLERKICDFERKILHLDENHKRTLHEKELILQNLKKAENDLAMLEKDLAEKNPKREDLEKTLMKLTEELRIQGREKVRLSSEKDSADKNLENTRSELSNLKMKIEQWNEKLRVKTAAFKKNSQIFELHTQKDKEKDKHEYQRWEGLVSQSRNEMENAETELASLHKKLEFSESKSASLSSQSEKLQSNLNSTTKEHDGILGEKSLKDQDLKSLETEIKNLNVEKERLQTAIQDSKVKESNFEKEAFDQENVIEELKEKAKFTMEDMMKVEETKNVKIKACETLTQSLESNKSKLDVARWEIQNNERFMKDYEQNLTSKEKEANIRRKEKDDLDRKGLENSNKIDYTKSWQISNKQLLLKTEEETLDLGKKIYKSVSELDQNKFEKASKALEMLQKKELKESNYQLMGGNRVDIEKCKVDIKSLHSELEKLQKKNLEQEKTKNDLEENLSKKEKEGEILENKKKECETEVVKKKASNQEEEGKLAGISQILEENKKKLDEQTSKKKEICEEKEKVQKELCDINFKLKDVELEMEKVANLEKQQIEQKEIIERELKEEALIEENNDLIVSNTVENQNERDNLIMS